MPGTLDSRAAADSSRQILIFIHGYANSEAGARAGGNELYKRLYWTGYRGQLVDFNWQGDDGEVPFINKDLFDPNVLNAFKTAPRLMDFLHGRVAKWTDGHPENVNIMAHSLGNLVMWEAMRLNTMLGLSPVVHNILSVEAAVWSEAFEPETPLTYPNPALGYTGDAETYSTDDLKRHSWRFWFRQQRDDGSGQEYNIKSNMAGGGRFYNSFAAHDFALVHWMRFNDWTLHGGPVQDHYWHLPGLHDGLRTLNNSNNSLEHIGALLSRRRVGIPPLGYTYDDLSLPLGAVPGAITDVAINARNFGWYDRGSPDNESASHSHFLGTADAPGMTDASLPSIWPWYDEVFATQRFVPLGNT
jgi:hypothetical protein